MQIKIKITREENAKLLNCHVGDTIQLDFEIYIAAVVASEIGNAALEACKAQAVAARTYAMYQGVLNGKSISDASSSAQAFRYSRYDKNKYPNALEGAQSTSGQILEYKNKPISAVFSHSNGGATASSKERQGSENAYLIAQKDPQDAATKTRKRGHGVGMSQVGAIYAAEHGVSYEQILAFYYPHTTLYADYGKKKLQSLSMTASNDLKEKMQQIKDVLIDIKNILEAI